MPRAIFVSLANIYAELASPGFGSDALRNCTCGWWRVNPVKAGSVEYAFGVRDGGVVSAYAVNVPVASWPVLPRSVNGKTGPEGEGRRYIPATNLSKGNWDLARRFRNVRMFGPVHYGDVTVDAQGNFVGDVTMDREHDSQE
jgi:hypothetical protein